MNPSTGADDRDDSGHRPDRADRAADLPVSDDGRQGNGLSASDFVPIAEADHVIGPALLQALRRANIAAYLQAGATADREVLYVAAVDRGDARTVVAAVWRAAQEAVAVHTDAAAPGEPDPMRQAVSVPDPLAGRDTDSEFNALIAGWHVDTVAAIRSVERDLNREDAEWRARITPPPPAETDEEEHFIPPVPPPLPRLAATTVGAIVLVAASIALLIAGGRLGLGGDQTFFAGVGGILFGAGVFVMKLRAQPDEDDDDDGAVL